MKPPVQQQSIRHCVEVKKWEHTVLPLRIEKILCRSPFLHPPRSDVRHAL